MVVLVTTTAASIVLSLITMSKYVRQSGWSSPAATAAVAVQETQPLSHGLETNSLADEANSLYANLRRSGGDGAIIETAQCGRHGVIALTYASHQGRDDRFCRSLESAIWNGIDLEILGWGVPWEGLSQKLGAALDVVSALPDDCVVLFSDAYDVMYSQSLRDIARKFVEIGKPLVFSAECGCWPHVLRDNGRTCRDAFPHSPTPYRYLNSGGWIGTAKVAAKFLRRVVEEAHAATKQDFHKLNDQELAAQLYLDRAFADDLTLDFFASIFQPTHAVRDSTAVQNCDPLPHLRPHPSQAGTLQNVLTNTIPAIYHFNGGGKHHHLELEAQMWWRTCDEANQPHVIDHLKAYTLAFNKRMLSFDHVCPTHFDKARLLSTQPSAGRRPNGDSAVTKSCGLDFVHGNIVPFLANAQNRSLSE